MTGGGYFVSRDQELYELASAALVAAGAVEGGVRPHGRRVQFTDSRGRVFTLEERVESGFEGELVMEPFRPAPGIERRDVERMAACPFECRWGDLTVDLAKLIAAGSEQPIWLIDGDGVMWDAQAVDPAALHL